MLIDCYKNGYESYVALGIMGSAPLIIISFLLPFLKIHIGDPIVGETYAPETKTPTQPTYVEPYVLLVSPHLLKQIFVKYVH